MATKEVVPDRKTEEKRLKMNYEEYLAWAEDVHAEWVDGEVIVFMPPKTRHQVIANFLEGLLTFFVRFFNLGRVLDAPFEMKPTPESNSREPDILFVAREHLDRLTEERLAGPADLVVELISDSSVARDRSDKFYEYEEAGIREYWVIDPRPGKERADFWVLDDAGRYRPVPIDDDGAYRSTVIEGFWLNVNWLWDEELPDPQRTFAKIAGFPQQLLDQLDELASRGPQE